MPSGPHVDLLVSVLAEAEDALRGSRRAEMRKAHELLHGYLEGTLGPDPRHEVEFAIRKATAAVVEVANTDPSAKERALARAMSLLLHVADSAARIERMKASGDMRWKGVTGDGYVKSVRYYLDEAARS